MVPLHQISQRKLCMHSDFRHACHMTDPSRPPCTILWRIYLNYEAPTCAVFSSFMPLPFPYIPIPFQRPVFKYPQSIFFSQYGSKFYTHTKQQTELWMCLLQFTVWGDVGHDYFAANSRVLPICASEFDERQLNYPSFSHFVESIAGHCVANVSHVALCQAVRSK